MNIIEIFVIVHYLPDFLVRENGQIMTRTLDQSLSWIIIEMDFVHVRYRFTIGNYIPKKVKYEITRPLLKTVVLSRGAAVH